MSGGERRRPCVFTFLLLLLPVSACARGAAPPPQAATREIACARFGYAALNLAGVVQEEDGGRPLPGAVVRVVGSRRAAVTDDRGEYRISGLTPGPHAVEATRVGYHREEREIYVHDGDVIRFCGADTTALLRFHMRPAGLSVRGRPAGTSSPSSPVS